MLSYELKWGAKWVKFQWLGLLVGTWSLGPPYRSQTNSPQQQVCEGGVVTYLLWFAAGKEIGWLYTHWYTTAHSHIIQIFLWNRWRSRFCFRTEMFLEAQGWSPGAITYVASGHIREFLGNNNETSPILWARQGTDSPASIFCWHSLWLST